MIGLECFCARIFLAAFASLLHLSPASERLFLCVAVANLCANKNSLSHSKPEMCLELGNAEETSGK